jgi:hypothetical protein
MKVGNFMATLSLTSREYPQHILDEIRYLGSQSAWTRQGGFFVPPFFPPPVRPPALFQEPPAESKFSQANRGLLPGAISHQLPPC